MTRDIITGAIIALIIILTYAFTRPTGWEQMCPMWSCSGERAYP